MPPAPDCLPAEPFPSRRKPLALAIALALSPPTVLGATITVDGSTCTLPEAVANANNDNDGGGNGCAAGSGTDLIVFDSSLSGSTIAPSTELTISSNLAIDGDLDDDGAPDVAVSGGNSHRVFSVASGSTVTLRGLVISDGFANATPGGGINNAATSSLTVQDCTISGNTARVAKGGGIFNQGTLTVQGSTISGNSASQGGGIHNLASLTVQNSTISGNSAYSNGGGIYTVKTGYCCGFATVENSTLAGNSVGSRGGGIYAFGNNSLTVLNSTISGNSAGVSGGGIYKRYNTTLTVRNSTISGNSAATDGGVSSHGNTLHLSNSVIANSAGGSDCHFSGILFSNTNNWIRDGTCNPAFVNDPGLGALADNGGPTRTHHPLVGSGLVDTHECLGTDQRGVTRPADGVGLCDIGAVEYRHCGADYELDDWWHQISLPCRTSTAPYVDSVFGDDLGLDDYLGEGGNDSWVVFGWDAANQDYQQLDLTSRLYQGQSYWIRSLNGGTIDIEGGPTLLFPNALCPSTNGCFDIALTPPPNTTSLLMIGHPLPYAIDWRDVRYVDGGTAKTPTQAQADNWVEKVFYRYNGNNYDTFDDDVQVGKLIHHDGIWIRTLANAPSGLELWIPAGGGHSAALTALTQFDPTAEGMRAAPGTLAQSAPDKPARRALPEGAVQLTASADGMIAANNQLGWRRESKSGYDPNDLPELPPPFDGPYLTLVFPHPDWGERAGDYTTDFHKSTRWRPRDSWSFEVRSDDTRSVTLQWSGPAEVLEGSVLVDEETGTEIPATEQGYLFDLTDERRTFRWDYSKKNKWLER